MLEDAGIVCSRAISIDRELIEGPHSDRVKNC